MPFYEATKHLTEEGKLNAVIEAVASSNIPYCNLQGEDLFGFLLATPAAIRNFSTMSTGSTLQIDFSTTKTYRYKDEIQLKQLMVTLVDNNGNSVLLFEGGTIKMTALVVGTMFSALKARVTSLGFRWPQILRFTVDGAAALTNVMVDNFSAFHGCDALATANFIAFRVFILFRHWYTREEEMKYSSISLAQPIAGRCWFHFNKDVRAYLKSSTTFQCDPTCRKEIKGLGKLFLQLLHCGESPGATVITMLILTSFVMSEEIHCASTPSVEDDEKCIYPINLADIRVRPEYLEVFLWGETPPEKKIRDILSATNWNTFYPLDFKLYIKVDKKEGGLPFLVFDATTAQQKCAILHKKYNSTMSQLEVDLLHKRKYAVLPTSKFSEDSGATDGKMRFRNPFFSGQLAKYFVDNVFRWWLCINNDSLCTRGG